MALHELVLSAHLSSKDIDIIIPSGTVWIKISTVRGSIMLPCEITCVKMVEDERDDTGSSGTTSVE